MWFFLGHELKDTVFSQQLGPLPSRFAVIPVRESVADALRLIIEKHPNEHCYGLVSPGCIPVTPDWWVKLEAAAGDDFIACAGRLRINEQPLGGVFCLGGDLVRAIGGLNPCANLRNGRLDEALNAVAETFELVRRVGDVAIERNAWVGGNPGTEDRATYGSWINSKERVEVCARVSKHLGQNLQQLDTSKVKLAVCWAMHDCQMDMDFYNSMHGSLGLLASYGINPLIIQSGGGSHVGKARERLLWNAMDIPDVTHILMVDSDMGWDPRLPMHLLCSDHDLCGAVGVKKDDTGDEPSFAASFYPGTQTFHPDSGFLKVLECGFAFMLMKRSVV